jgi:hypothetical protein
MPNAGGGAWFASFVLSLPIAVELYRYASFDGVPVYDSTCSTRTIFNLSMPESKSAKKTTLQLVERLDEDVTYEDIMYELYALQKIERGLRDAEEGRTVPHDEVKDHLSQWLK